VKAWLFVLSATLAVWTSSSPPPDALEIYAIDVEGGKATLVVAPSRESLLIDTGNAGEGARRDAERIMAAVRDAGLQQIDHLVTTHWHRDHFGGMAALANQIPIREFIDHGANVQPDAVADAFLRTTYPGLIGAAAHRVVTPGDTIPITGLDIRVVASAGDVLKPAPTDAGTVNPYCAGVTRPSDDPGENARSIGLQLSFGRFRVVDLGDLSSDREFDLMCPNNPLGTADVFMVSHHGQPRSNLPPLVHAIEARVAIMNNGIRKGGQPEVMSVIHSAPGLETLWQLHVSQRSGREYNAPELFIANLTAGSDHDGTAYWIKVSARPDGSFTVTNGRNGFSKTYRARGLLLSER
jgi:competence protein ComEC